MPPNSQSAMEQISSYISYGRSSTHTLDSGVSSRDMSSSASDNDLVFVTSYTDFDR